MSSIASRLAEGFSHNVTSEKLRLPTISISVATGRPDIAWVLTFGNYDAGTIPDLTPVGLISVRGCLGRGQIGAVKEGFAQLKAGSPRNKTKIITKQPKQRGLQGKRSIAGLKLIEKS
jgi:hypothetical protein